MKRKWLFIGLLLIIIAGIVALTQSSFRQRLIKITESLQGQDSSFEIEIDSMIGGGFAGAADYYLINALGEVYNFTSPTFHEEEEKKLVRRIDRQTVKKLRACLIKADFGSMEEGDPSYGGQSWRVVINGREKTIYFEGTPTRLLEAEKILEEILQKNLY